MVSNVSPVEEKPGGGGFEKDLERIEAIIERIESGEIGLEASIKEWEEGVALVKRCREILRQAEQKIADLTAEMEKDVPDDAR